MTVQRPRSSSNVDITCAQCGKPMMMLSFNYMSLERGFESVSLRCQYCKAEETRPWPKEELVDISSEMNNREPIRDGDDHEASPRDGGLKTGGELTDEALQSHGADREPRRSDAMQNEEDSASSIKEPDDSRPGNTAVTVTGITVTGVTVTRSDP